MTWFRRLTGAAPPAPTPPAAPEASQGDSPEELRQSLAALVRFINAKSGRLPGAAVVAARRVTDTLRDIIDTSELRPLDVYAVSSVQKTMGDYLPVTLQTFLAVDDGLRDTRRPGGRTPAESLLEQIDFLHTSTLAVLRAAHDQDLDALMTQGSFLRTKFSGSDLDL